jgi:hypothetical protein
MSDRDTDEGGMVVRLESAQAVLRDHFLGWQCRLRQMAVRQAGGQPMHGMRPQMVFGQETASAVEVTVLIVQHDPFESTAQFRHIVRRTRDPAERHENAVKYLSSAYYQQPREFSDELTALFGPGLPLVEQVLQAGACTLDFDQYSQRYRLPCTVRRIAPSEPAHQATYWHNAMFNANLPAGVQVIGFRPDWSRAEADPSPV